MISRRAWPPRVQLTSDGHKPYLEAIEGAFGSDIDFSMLVKVYGAAPEGQRRYSPAICTGAPKYRVEGHPDPKHVSTSFVERGNLSMRMGNRTKATGPKDDKAVACLAKDRAVLLAFYDFPAEHWKHIRTTNPIESTFATVRMWTPPAVQAGI